jgi:hypothetical protein
VLGLHRRPLGRGHCLSDGGRWWSYTPDVGAVGLLVGGVRLCEPIPSRQWWSVRGSLVLFEHLVNEELGCHAVDCSLFDFCVGVDFGGFDYVVDDGFSQPLQEISDGRRCCEQVFSLPGDSFEVLDVLVDVGPFHLHVFYLKACSFFGLRILELVSELVQEMHPNIGDVFKEWVQSVHPVSLVEGPFVYCQAFDESQHYCYATDPGLEAGDRGIYAEVVS